MITHCTLLSHSHLALVIKGNDDDDIGALGSILSWDEDEDGAVSGPASNSALSDRESLNSSALPDLVSFNMKDGGPALSALDSVARN